MFGQQNKPIIEARFANAEVDYKSGKLYADVELSSLYSRESLFAMNARVVFDASIMTFDKIDELHGAYSVMGQPFHASIGKADNGVAYYGFEGSPGYLNGAIHLTNPAAPIELRPGAWSKVMRVSFNIQQELFARGATICPSLIWDQKVNGVPGSYYRGSEGLVITVMNTNRNLNVESAPTATQVVPFNWTSDKTTEAPFGRVNREQCFTLGVAVSTDGPSGPKVIDEVLVFQNQPNPVEQFTVIEFVMPAAQRATLTIYDLDGKMLEQISGYYENGKNQLTLKGKSWMNRSQTVYYRIETDTFRSEAFKMSVAARS